MTARIKLPGFVHILARPPPRRKLGVSGRARGGAESDGKAAPPKPSPNLTLMLERFRIGA